MEIRRTNLYRCLLWAVVLAVSACSEYDLSQDQTLPSLLSTTASNDAIVLQFDEIIEASSLSYQTFTLHDDRQRDLTRNGQFYLFDEFIELRAPHLLQSGKSYQVTLSGLTDRAANPLPKVVVSVTPEAAVVNSVVVLDQRAPSLLSHIPEADASAVELSQSLVLNFSEAMSCASLQGALTLSGVDTELTSCQGRRVVYRPLEPLQREARYEAVLLGATDLAGNLLPFANWSFSTEGSFVSERDADVDEECDELCEEEDR
ncbi:MAG: Ig-like domain-containing protein [Gammaproteobacteria bacterium]|nr:Ig-like domain-containing protein [Gammaproteobacteria bacterium]